MIDEQTVWSDVWPVVERLITATVAEDSRTIESLLLPNDQAAEALDLHGFVVFDILLKTVLGRERLGLVRAIEANDGRSVFVEYAWPDPDSPDRSYTAVDVVTVRLDRAGDGWLVAEVNPAGADLLLNGLRALSVLAGSQVLSEDDRLPGEPWVLPVALYAGALPLPLRPEAMADEVEELLLPGLQQRKYGLPAMISGRRLWRDFQAKARPDLEELASWAAAVEYILSEQSRHNDTQAAVGRYYSVSLNRIAPAVRQIKRALAIENLDARYSELITTEILYEESQS